MDAPTIPIPSDEMISVREYLSTTYRPDRDYVDGMVVERNLGEYDHARLQGVVFAYFYARRKQWDIIPVVEQRVQVSSTRFRIPDVCVLLRETPQQVFRTPPFIFIEILSKDDRLSEMRRRVQDYLDFGVPYVWIFDPETRKAFRCMPDALFEVNELRTDNPELIVPIAELFED